MANIIAAPYSDFQDFTQVRRYLDELVRDLDNYVTVFEEEDFRPLYSEIDSSTQAEGQYLIYLADATTGNITISLPDAELLPGSVFTFKKTDSSGNYVRFQSSSANIDGASTLSTTSQYVSYTVLSDGTSWQIISKVV